MALSYRFDGTNDYKQNIYSITLDMSGWQKTTIQVEAPVAGAIYVYSSNDAGAVQGETYGDAQLATNFTPIQVTNLSTGTAVSNFNAAGNYKADINARFLRVQGGGADVYKIIFNHYKE